MNIFKSVVGFFTGGTKTADTLIEGAVKGIDTLYFSPEEKAEMSKETFQLYIEYQKATAPQNVSRRHIALGIVGVYLFLVLLMVIVYPFLVTYSEFIFKILSEILHWPVVTIISFFYLKRMNILKEKNG